MTIYFLIFAILAFFSLIEIFGLDKTYALIIFGVLSIFLYFISFIRWETGTDWGTYFSFFNDSNVWFGDSDFEWGYARINEVIRICFDNYSVLLFVLASIVFTFQSKAILKFSPYPITSLFVLWSVSYGNIFFVRQTIATVILLYSIKFVEKREFWKFVLFIALAMLFHRTSIVFIFAWWVYKLEVRPIVLAFYICISIFFSVVVGKVMGTLGGVIGGVLQQKLDFYLSDSDNSFGAESSVTQTIIKGFSNKIFVFIISTLMLEKIENEDFRFRGYFNIYWAGIIIYFSTVSVSVALVRLSFAYDIVLIIIIPFILRYVDSYPLRFLAFLIFLIYLSARMYVTITGSYYDSFVPFKTIFNF